MRQRMARPNIKEVASAAGVSTQTLSRVINKRPDVSPETRKRVQAVIEALGYKPGVLARGLINQRSYTLGMVTAGLEYIGTSRLVNGIAATEEQAGYSLLLKELPLSNKYNIRPIFHALPSWQVNGSIWAVPEVGENNSEIHNAALDINVPLVYVAIDHYQGGDWQ